MATREEIKSEVEKVPNERLEELYRVVKTFSDENGEGDWSLLSQEGLAGAYGEVEPEYSLELVKEPNPECNAAS